MCPSLPCRSLLFFTQKAPLRKEASPQPQSHSNLLGSFVSQFLLTEYCSFCCSDHIKGVTRWFGVQGLAGVYSSMVEAGSGSGSGSGWVRVSGNLQRTVRSVSTATSTRVCACSTRSHLHQQPGATSPPFTTLKMTPNTN